MSQLAARGYRHYGLRLTSGEVQLDPMSERVMPSTVVSLCAEAAVELAGAISRHS
jgi:hypothetical protein